MSNGTVSRSNYRIKFAVNFGLAKIHAASVIFDYAPVCRAITLGWRGEVEREREDGSGSGRVAQVKSPERIYFTCASATFAWRGVASPLRDPRLSRLS